VRHDGSSYGFLMAARTRAFGKRLGVGVPDLRMVWVKVCGKGGAGVRLCEENRFRA